MKRSKLAAGWCAGVVAVALLVGLVRTASAQPAEPPLEAAFGKEALAEVGALVVGELEPAAVEKLVELCGKHDKVEDNVACLARDAEAAAILKAAHQKAEHALVEALGEAVVKEHGAALLKLDKPTLGELAKTCPEGEGREACVKQHLSGAPPAGEPPKPAPEAQAYPPEVLELFPQPILDVLPKLLTRFLRVEDYRALKKACPEPAPEALGACLAKPDTQALLNDLLGVAVVDDIVGYMDAEIPKRLGADAYHELFTTCEKQGDDWANCTLAKSLEDEACTALEEALADCVTDNDIITQQFTEVQRDKKAAFAGAEFYVDVAGMLAALDLETTKKLRQACPANGRDEFLACLAADPVFSNLDDLFSTIASAAVAEAAGEIRAAGGGEIDQAKYQVVVYQALLAYPVHALKKLTAECQKQKPELASMKTAADLDALLACVDEASETSPVANPAFIGKDTLRKWLGIGREKVMDMLRKKERAGQVKSTWRILIVLGAIGALGALLVLGSPLVLRRKYPSVSGGVMWKSSAFAAATFLVTIALLGVTLLIQRTVQGYVATDSTSPVMRIAAGTFDALQEDKYVQSFSDLSKARLDFIKEPLRNVMNAREDDTKSEEYLSFAAYVATHWSEMLEQPEVKHIMRNVDVVKKLVGGFKSALKVYKSVDWILKLLPILLPLLTVLLYLLPMKDTLKEIATAPARAAAESAGAGAAGGPGMFQRAKGTVLAEMKLVWPFLAVVLVFLPLVGLCLSLIAKPLVDMFVEHALMSVFYIGFGAPSALGFYLSIGAAALLLGLGVVIYILAMSFFLGKVRVILRSKYHFGQTYRQYKQFWLWGVVAVVFAMALPVGYAYGASFLMDKLHADLDWLQLTTNDMILVPLIAFLGFPVLYWALRGFKALNWIRKYPVVLTATPAAAPAAAAPPAATPAS
ncbi:MAG: Clr5 domain-containing protein [Polyangiaceae bacterium]|nr:Clr5 domain-containing protein [Polyangiaceae bacterium]